MAGLEKWEVEPFEAFHEYHHRTYDLLHMLREATHFVQARPTLIETLRQDEPEDDWQKELAQAKRNAELARVEGEAGYPILHAQAAILLWGGLETLILDFLASWLANRPESHSLEPIRQLKIGYGEFMGVPPEERGSYILERLEDKLGTKRAGGADRFEGVFKVFGLTSPIDAGVTRDLLELSAVRNLLVHRRGIVDSRFQSRCPWLSSTLGKLHVVSHADYHRYFDAVDLYVFEIVQRLRLYHGLARTGHQPSCHLHGHPQEQVAAGTKEPPNQRL